MAPHVNAIIASVDMVFPPITNSEVAMASKNPAVVSLLRTSDFYMIGGRAQSYFFDISVEEASGNMLFGIAVKGGRRGKGPFEAQRIAHSLWR